MFFIVDHANITRALPKTKNNIAHGKRKLLIVLTPFRKLFGLIYFHAVAAVVAFGDFRAFLANFYAISVLGILFTDLGEL